MEKIKFSLKVLMLLIAFPVVVFAELNHRNDDAERNDNGIEKSISVQTGTTKQCPTTTDLGLHPLWANEPILSFNQ